MKCMIYGSKYEVIPKNVVAVPGRVGMEECSLDFIFYSETDQLLLAAIHLFNFSFIK